MLSIIAKGDQSLSIVEPAHGASYAKGRATCRVPPDKIFDPFRDRLSDARVSWALTTADADCDDLRPYEWSISGNKIQSLEEELLSLKQRAYEAPDRVHCMIQHAFFDDSAEFKDDCWVSFIHVAMIVPSARFNRMKRLLELMLLATPPVEAQFLIGGQMSWPEFINGTPLVSDDVSLSLYRQGSWDGVADTPVQMLMERMEHLDRRLLELVGFRRDVTMFAILWGCVEVARFLLHLVWR